MNGINIYPEIIEQKIKKGLKINNCSAVGVNDKLTNEKVLLFVEKNKNLNYKKIYNFCNNNLERYEVPKKIILLDKLPKTNLGKINISFLKTYYNQ